MNIEKLKHLNSLVDKINHDEHYLKAIKKAEGLMSVKKDEPSNRRISKIELHIDQPHDSDIIEIPEELYNTMLKVVYSYYYKQKIEAEKELEES